MKRFILFLVTAFIVFTGCKTPPKPLPAEKPAPTTRPTVPVTENGVDVAINIFESDDFENDDGTKYSKRIIGLRGVPLKPQDVVLTFSGATLRETINEKTVIDDLIRDLPKGLTARIREAQKGSNKLTILVTGTPSEAREDSIVINFAPGVLTVDIGQIIFDEAGYEIREPIPRVQKVLIDGATDNQIIRKDVIINLPGEELVGVAPGSVVSWISNLPSGLTARVKEAKEDKKEHEVRITLTVEGTPRSESINEALSITIPAGIIRNKGPIAITNEMTKVKVDGEDKEIPEARFFITGNIRQYSVSEIPDSNETLNTATRMNIQKGPLNWPTLTSPKDYDGVGIVSVSAVQVEKLGADNKYHWTGQTVTYSNLMDEARKIGGHAIINVVIDYVDSWEYIEVKKELSPEHELTDAEDTKIKTMGEGGKKILEIIDGAPPYSVGKRVGSNAGKTPYSVESTHVLTRTYTGTALAIKLR